MDRDLEKYIINNKTNFEFTYGRHCYFFMNFNLTFASDIFILFFYFDNLQTLKRYKKF